MAADQFRERGSTAIVDPVMTKILTHTARQALDGVRPERTTPQAVVSAHHGGARVRVGVKLDYHCDIGAQCDAMRRHVAARVKALAGAEVPQVQVSVEPPHSAESRRSAHGRAR